MIAAPAHPREAQRLRSLHTLLQRGMTHERVLDTVTSLASRLLDMPVSMLNLLDRTHARAVSVGGAPTGEALAREEAMCAWTVASDGWLAVPDLKADPRFHDGDVVASGMRSYHGSPVAGADGLPLGALCVLDRRPRILSAEQRRILEDLAALASTHLTLMQRSVTAGAEAGGPGLQHPTPRTAAEQDSLDLTAGLAAGELIPFFQPIVDMTSRRIVGVEALARWEHPTRGLLGPAAFLPAAEEDDLVLVLDATMLEEACHQVQQWRSTRPDVADLELSVNISGRHLGGTALVDLVHGALSRSGLPAASLTLELTETVLVQAEREETLTGLMALRERGVGLALDDFGTAYSTLSYLRRFPVSRLKVDRSFVAGLGSDPRDELLVESVVSLAQRLGLDVVAEGVETVSQARVLEAMVCPKAQGFHFQRPVSAEELELSGILGAVGSGLSVIPMLEFPHPM